MQISKKQRIHLINIIINQQSIIKFDIFYYKFQKDSTQSLLSDILKKDIKIVLLQNKLIYCKFIKFKNL